MRIREEYTCPLEIVHDLIRGKWKTLLVFQLREGPRSFSQLLRETAGISEKMLLQQLKELQAFGVIGKTSGEGYPLHVSYWLTERGGQLLRAVRIMQDIGVAYMVECGQAELLRSKGIAVPEVPAPEVPAPKPAGDENAQGRADACAPATILTKK